MGDCISRVALLAAYDAAHVGSPGGARKLIEEAPAVAVPEWISVEERLPGDEGKVLVYYGFDNDVHGDLGMMSIGTLCYFCFDPDPHWQHASLNLVVTHWMPIPEPPKGGGGNG